MKSRQLYKKYFIEPVVSFATDERMRFYPLLIIAVSMSLLVYNVVNTKGLVDGFGNVVGTDFLAFYAGGRFYLEGMQEQLYDFTAQLDYQQQLAGKLAGQEELPPLLPFVNPPFAVWVYVPFALKSYLAGYTLWMVTGIACFLTAVYMMKRRWLKTCSISFSKLIFYCISFFPVILWLLYSQATGLLFLLLALSLLLLGNGKEFQSGLMLGLLAFKPQIAVCIALPLIINLRWRALCGGMLSVALWLAVGFLEFPSEMKAFWDFKATIVNLILSTDSGYPIWGVSSIAGFCYLLVGSYSGKLAAFLSISISLALFLKLIIFWRRMPWRPDSAAWRRGMAGSFAIGLLMGVHLFSYDLALLVIPFFLLLSTFDKGRDIRLDHGPMLAWTVCVYLTAFIGPYFSNLTLAMTANDQFDGLALQVSTLCVLGWGGTLLESAEISKQQECVNRLGLSIQNHVVC